jgi:hypothetical protein
MFLIICASVVFHFLASEKDMVKEAVNTAVSQRHLTKVEVLKDGAVVETYEGDIERGFTGLFTPDSVQRYFVDGEMYVVDISDGRTIKETR